MYKEPRCTCVCVGMREGVSVLRADPESRENAEDRIWIVIGKELASKAEAEIRKGLKGDYEGTMCCTQTNGSPNSDNI